MFIYAAVCKIHHIFQSPGIKYHHGFNFYAVTCKSCIKTAMDLKTYHTVKLDI